MATPNPSPHWFSTSQAGAALGISARAVQKRCTAGTLVARRVPVPGGFKWEVDGRELEGGTPEPTSELEGGTGELYAQRPANQGRNPGTGTPELEGGTGEPGHELWAQREREMKAEINFLRGVIEQLQRDGAETRQALKKALDLAPKQLTMGTPTDGPQRDESGAAGSSGPTTANGSQRPTGGRESAPITYDSIADEIERGMNR